VKQSKENVKGHFFGFSKTKKKRKNVTAKVPRRPVPRQTPGTIPFDTDDAVIDTILQQRYRLFSERN